MQTDSDFLFAWRRPARPFAGSLVLSGWLLAALMGALFAANAALHFPGVMNNDSVAQYRQAVNGHYGDWHPPIMAWLWSWLRYLHDGPGPFLLLHLALYWTGFGLFADGLRRIGWPKLAFAVALAGAFPPFLYVNAQVVKDVGMAVSWLAAAGALYWFRVQRRRIPVAAAICMAVLLFYGTMVRTNAVFGLGPLLLFALAPRSWLHSARLMVAAVVVAVMALPAGMLANRVLFQPKQENAVQSLFLFDLMGIAVHSGDPSLMEPRATFRADELRACYSPYWWDSISQWGRCAAKVHRPDADTPTLPEGLAAQWLTTIAHHPLAYAEHRLKHFNSALLFLVPSKHVRLTPEYRTDDPAVKPLEVVTERDVKLDIVRKNFAIWPVTWLAWAACLLFLLRHEAAVTGVVAARTLAVSALGYSGAYLLIGVATDMRYHYWSLLAVLVASTVVLPALLRQWRERRGPLLACAAIVGAVVLLGTLARLADFRGFV
ncbi:hypothetical protein [Ramlibacter humi]|uniref:hypothetical protein n=1 Tax=Ramlibacter humi TaxID=2530451 RepID=UPI001431FD09|nr:hypothetical protein [Ramlibacter humi]